MIHWLSVIIVRAYVVLGIPPKKSLVDGVPPMRAAENGHRSVIAG